MCMLTDIISYTLHYIDSGDHKLIVFSVAFSGDELCVHKSKAISGQYWRLFPEAQKKQLNSCLNLTFEKEGEALKGSMCLTEPATELKWLFPLASETSMLTSLSRWVKKLYWPQQHSSELSTHSLGINRLLRAFVHLCFTEYI